MSDHRVHKNPSDDVKEQEEQQQESIQTKLQSLQSTNTTNTTNINTTATSTINNMTSPSNTSNDSGLITPPAFVALGMMPCPGQPDAPYFDGTDVTEFLRQWNIDCEDFGISEPKKCDRLPYYCSKEVREVVELLDGYSNKD